MDTVTNNLFLIFSVQSPQEDPSQKKQKTEAGESRVGGFMKRIKIKPSTRNIAPEGKKNSRSENYNTSDEPYFLRRQSSIRSKVPNDVTIIFDEPAADENADTMSVVIDRLVENFRDSFDSPNNTLTRPKNKSNYVKTIVAAFEEKYGSQNTRQLSPLKIQRPATVRRVSKVCQLPTVEAPVEKDKLEPAVVKFWSNQIFLETKLKDVDQKLTQSCPEPQIVGAYLKKPVWVEGKKIDYIPIINQKLPRKRSLKRAISEVAEKRMARSDTSGLNHSNFSVDEEGSIKEERMDVKKVPVLTLKRKSWSKSLAQAPKKAREFCSFPKISANKSRARTPLKEIFENNNNSIDSNNMNISFSETYHDSERKVSNKENCDCVTPGLPVQVKKRSLFFKKRPRSDALDEVQSFYRRYDCVDADLHNLVQMNEPVYGNDIVLTLRNLKLQNTTDKGRPKSAVLDTRPEASDEKIESYAATIRERYLGNLDEKLKTVRGSGKVQPEAEYFLPNRSSAFFENRMKNANFGKIFFN